MTKMYDQLHSRGLEILAFPCNQFFSQENGSEAEIKKFVKENFNANFPIFSKVEVNGENTHPLFVYLRNNSELYDKQTGTSKVIPWNFAKFILNSKGQVIKFAPPTTPPEDLRAFIEEELGK